MPLLPSCPERWLVHVSEISEERVENVSDYFVEGEEVKVKVLEVDRQEKLDLP